MKTYVAAFASLLALQGQTVPSAMKRIGTVDERFQSYNIEMVEVTGGRFWAPYGAKQAAAAPAAPARGAGLDPSLYMQREPIDLGSRRLRTLAAALGPAYVRVSGTWANSTYFHDSDAAAPSAPPAGFGGVLTRAQWRGVVEFSRATGAEIVTSFAISPGVRDDAGRWTPKQAGQLVAYTKKLGGRIAAAEFFNEPNFAGMGGAPKGYDAKAYGKDFQLFREFATAAAPEMVIAGPGSVGEGTKMGGPLATVRSEDMLRESGAGVGVFSYHFYGAASARCGGMPGAPQSSPETALGEAWLGRTELDWAYYAGLRDRYEPGKPLWLTETAETACGGNRWASSFVDSFRYLEQLGRLAKKGVQVVAHNTLSASDYGLIDEATMTPRPNYWAALLWKRLMGRTVLESGAEHVYAHCLQGVPGGVALLAVNPERVAGKLAVPLAAERYTLTAKELLGHSVELNGRELGLAGEALPKMAGRREKAGTWELAPLSITFVAIAGAGNPACR